MHAPTAPNQGLNMREQYRAGRTRLYTMSFADFEHEIRDELGRMLNSAGFDFDRDVAAITVNRWPHGYAYTPTPLYDDPAHQAQSSPARRGNAGSVGSPSPTQTRAGMPTPMSPSIKRIAPSWN
jgi:spermidine dehydrogenase